MSNVAMDSCNPGMAVARHAGTPCCRNVATPSSVRAGSGPSATIRRGAISMINRCRNGRQVAISFGLGGRSPGGRHGINGVSAILSRSRPMERSISSRYEPVGPANGSPDRSASAFGASPTNNNPLVAAPPANTRFVAVSRNGLPSKAAMASRSASSVVAAAAACVARSAGAPRGDVGVAWAGGGDGRSGTATGREGAARSRSIGASSSASSAPHSICNFRAA